ncbi:hypothetical protein CVT26_012353, partial [Gymnopilus dilepis]
DSACQKRDWKHHKQYCNDNPDTHGPSYETIKSYDYRFMDGFLSFALVKLKVQKRFGHLSSDDFRKEWLEVACAYFVHVYLVAVKNPPPGRFNRVRFHSVRLASTHLFKQPIRDSIHGHLNVRFPAFTIGYSIVSGDINVGEDFVDIYPPPTKVEAFIHKIPYPFPPTPDLDPFDILKIIALHELQSRESAAASSPWQKNKHHE